MTSRSDVLRATVTPLASIFGSGFLIIVPILAQSLGRWSALGMAAVCALAWCVGDAVRHNVRTVEGHEVGAAVRRLERASDLTIVVAYVISVALYLRILAQFVVGYAGGSLGAQKVLAVAVVGLITAVGLVRGLHGLQVLERSALAVVIVIVLVLLVTFAVRDASLLVGDGVTLTRAHDGLGGALLVLGGIVITVQGFETIRYQPDVDAEVRVAASRLAQLVATGVYLALVGLATPLMSIAEKDGNAGELLTFVQSVAPFLALPLVVTAALSQFSAATADTEAGKGNLRVLPLTALHGKVGYVVIGLAAAALAASLGTSVIVVVASRAFAAYYALQCAVAALQSHGRRRAGFVALVLVMVAVTVLAKPAG